ncbi:YtpR family tRNA-binding protein [Planococcus sp. YIM B11945]|uniref:YtpR family tRNA-binding protein n=1 Tax=Planococcus sp. YIM B11945 TaxID=3435410 RepID=UPI003D7D1E25
MNAFYNKNGIGDVLLVQLQTEKPEEIQTEQSGDITLIKDAEGTIVGFNLFQASSYIDFPETEAIDLSEELVTSLQNALEKNDIDFTLEVDLSPKFVVGYVEAKEKHPNADKLNVCQVSVGTEQLQIVCGAPNVEQGQKVVVAKVGAVMPSGLLIKDAELRGVASSGMICSAKELALPDAPQEKGILVLPADAEVGSPFEVKA